MSSPFSVEEFDRALAEAQTTLTQLQERYTQVKQDQEQLAQLQATQQQLKKQKRPRAKNHPLLEELAQIEAQIAAIELNLESRLFRWDRLQEPFWQALRFGGLGLILGWLLHYWSS